VDFGLVAAKETSNHRGDAGDMNMQLALAAAGRRIYGHSDLVSQQLTARPLLNKAARVPSCLPIVWGVLALQRRTFNTGYAGGWNDDDMRVARRCLEHGKASIETVGYIDLCARKRDADAPVGRHAYVMDNEPQLTSVGCRYGMRRSCDHGSDQAHGHTKLVNLAQEGPSPKILLVAGLKHMQSGFSPGAQLNWSLALNVTCKGDLWADLAVPSLGRCDKVYDANLGDRQSARF
jgi:hypothetical protein